MYYRARLSLSNGGAYELIVLQPLKMGRVQAANAVGDGIRKWRPRYVLLVGIAGGMPENDRELGDILIAEQVVDYEVQKIRRGGNEPRYDVYQSDPRLLMFAKTFSATSWSDRVAELRPAAGTPSIHFGPILSGDKILADDCILGRYKREWPKLVGVEMEAGGVASASAQNSPPTGFFMVRAISDFADEHKNSDEVALWRPYACEVAAGFAIDLLRAVPLPLKIPGDGT